MQFCAGSFSDGRVSGDQGSSIESDSPKHQLT